jgi:3-deoxy-D-manno-octulosonic-acid transferase
MKVARERLSDRVDRIFFMPLDLWLNWERLIARLRPSIFLLVETDIWPALLHVLNGKRIPCMLINGRISPSTYRYYKIFSFIVKRIFANFSMCMMQSPIDRERLMDVKVGCPVVVSGNIKFDRRWERLGTAERSIWLDLMGYSLDDPIWVAGSTHRGEEEIILGVFFRLRKILPDLRLILAPRRMEDCGRAFEIALETGLNPVLRSELPSGDKTCDLVILDSIGELERIYGLAAVSFVGGSLVPFGGHNLLEPAAHGSAVLFGPHTHNFAEMADMLISAGGGIRVADGEGLFVSMKSLLLDSERCLEAGRRAEDFVTANSGALSRVSAMIMEYLSREKDLITETSASSRIT